jgi:hypothetical protein
MTLPTIHPSIHKIQWKPQIKDDFFINSGLEIMGFECFEFQKLDHPEIFTSLTTIQFQYTIDM